MLTRSCSFFWSWPAVSAGGNFSSSAPARSAQTHSKATASRAYPRNLAVFMWTTPNEATGRAGVAPSGRPRLLLAQMPDDVLHRRQEIHRRAIVRAIKPDDLLLPR